MIFPKVEFHNAMDFVQRVLWGSRETLKRKLEHSAKDDVEAMIKKADTIFSEPKTNIAMVQYLANCYEGYYDRKKETIFINCKTCVNLPITIFHEFLHHVAHKIRLLSCLNRLIDMGKDEVFLELLEKWQER